VKEAFLPNWPVNYYKRGIMSKTLILVRHGKAENRDISINDFNRALTPEGKADTMKMANFLHNAGIAPDFIITSSATRAFETAMIFAEVFKTNKNKTLPTRSLYYSSAKTILDQIYSLQETVRCVLIVAHNPGISDLNRGLSSGKSFSMDNTQVSILEYEMEHWYQIDEQKPITFRSKKPLEITP
jgi:phosphohistidine phosphatase